jgi:hypothetical protein
MRLLRPVLSAALTLLAVTGWASSASAHAISVLRPDAADAVLTEAYSRLCGELRMYGFEVRLLDARGGLPDPDAPPAEVGTGDVIGAVVLLRAAGQASAKIWIAEEASRSVRITVSIDDADAPSLLAIRTADLLRASLRDVAAPATTGPQPASAGAALPAIAVVETQQPRGQRWYVEAGASLLWETGEWGAGAAPSVRFGRRVSEHFALSLAVDAPVMSQTYRTAGATARLRYELVGLAMAWRAVAHRRVSVDLSQGLGVMHLSVRGEAQSPWTGQTAAGWAATATTGASLGLHLSDHAGVAVSLAAVFALPRPAIEVADATHVAHQPFLLTSAGFQYGF